MIQPWDRSVLSAIEGVKVAAPSVSGLVIPITVAIIIALFLVQRLGTGAVGRLFGPVMGVWFTVLELVENVFDSPFEGVSSFFGSGFSQELGATGDVIDPSTGEIISSGGDSRTMMPSTLVRGA